ncbi:uncharacterized protein LOC105218354 [Zeugodacus cucurbitae]|uniref:uncharacterized protein LOC105218354 n=1 Tax=Zeugodacus cucurbitae TaxID=28588 RepID=UPI0005969829|nr:uncharacterized protein LOC105218354 [Zeugodacus cucurbitae]
MSDETASSTDVVREVIKNSLKDISTILRPNNDASDEEKELTPTSNKDKIFDILIKEMCGHVNDNLRNLCYVSCECDEKDVMIKEENCIKQMKTDTRTKMKLYTYLLKELRGLKKDPHLNVKLYLPSVERKSKTTMRERLYSPIHIPGDEPIVVLGQYSTYLCKSDYEKICWSSTQSAARSLCGLVFSREKILQTDFINTLLEPYKIADIESCILTSTISRSEDILRAIARKCYDTHRRFKKRRMYAKTFLDDLL